MVYIAPEDQDIQTGDGVLRLAWSDRRQLRLDELELRNKIKALDTFIATYIERAKPVFSPGHPQVSVTVPSAGGTVTMVCTCKRPESGSGWATGHAIDPRCPAHGNLAWTQQSSAPRENQ